MSPDNIEKARAHVKLIQSGPANWPESPEGITGRTRTVSKKEKKEKKAKENADTEKKESESESASEKEQTSTKKGWFW